MSGLSIPPNKFLVLGVLGVGAFLVAKHVRAAAPVAPRTGGGAAARPAAGTSIGSYLQNVANWLPRGTSGGGVGDYAVGGRDALGRDYTPFEGNYPVDYSSSPAFESGFPETAVVNPAPGWDAGLDESWSFADL